MIRLSILAFLDAADVTLPMVWEVTLKETKRLHCAKLLVTSLVT